MPTINLLREPRLKWFTDLVTEVWKLRISDVQLVPSSVPHLRMVKKGMTRANIREFGEGYAVDILQQVISKDQIGALYAACTYNEMSNALSRADKTSQHYSFDHDGHWRVRVTFYNGSYVRGNSADDDNDGFNTGSSNTSQMCVGLRILPHTPLMFGNLGFPEELGDSIKARSGLIAICGITGAGKSTTLAALMIELARLEGHHLGTLEAPIEYVIRKQAIHDSSLVVQSEIGADFPSWALGVESFLRRELDTVVIGESFPFETNEGGTLNLTELVIQLAGTGHRVMTTLHAKDFYEAFFKLTWRKNAHDTLAAKIMALRHLSAIIVQQLVFVPNLKENARSPYKVKLYFGVLTLDEETREMAISCLGKDGEEQHLRRIFDARVAKERDGCVPFSRIAKSLMRDGVEPSQFRIGPDVSAFK